MCSATIITHDHSHSFEGLPLADADISLGPLSLLAPIACHLVAGCGRAESFLLRCVNIMSSFSEVGSLHGASGAC